MIGLGSDKKRHQKGRLKKGASWADVQEEVLEVVPERRKKQFREFQGQQPEALLLTDTLVETQAVLKDADNKDAWQEGEQEDRPLDNSPHPLFTSKVDHHHCVADHDVAEDNNSNWKKSVEAKEGGAQERSECTKHQSNFAAAEDREFCAEDEQYQGKYKDLSNTVPNYQLVHSCQGKALFCHNIQAFNSYPYLIFVTGATGGARVNFFWPV